MVVLTIHSVRPSDGQNMKKTRLSRVWLARSAHSCGRLSSQVLRMGVLLISLCLSACSTLSVDGLISRVDLSDIAISRQNLEWVNDVSRRVLVDPHVHDVAEKGLRPLVDSIWYAVIEEARADPTGPRRSFADFANSLDGLNHDEKSRRVHAWFLKAGWALWGRPTRKHPDMLLRLTGVRIDSQRFQIALDRVFSGIDVLFTDPWLINISSQPVMAWSSPGVPVVNRHQVANISARMYGGSDQQFSRLQQVVAGLTMVEEAIQWRMKELSQSSDSLVSSLPASFSDVEKLTHRNLIQIVAMAVAFNIDKSAFDLYYIQMQQCQNKLNTDECRHLAAMSEFLPDKVSENTNEKLSTSVRLPILSADAAIMDQIRERYTVVAQELLKQIY